MSPDLDPQRGSGLFGTLMGFTVFMLLMIAAVQVLFSLHATTVVTSAAFDAARLVAGYDSVADRCAATEAAESSLRQRLRRYLEHGTVTLSWTCSDPETVRLAVERTIRPSCRGRCEASLVWGASSALWKSAARTCGEPP